MTLPASGTITMGQVKTELGISGALTLTDSRVRTLFVKPSGVIKLTDGYGKSAVTASRPNGATYYGTTPTNPTYAYNGTAADADFTDSTTLATSAQITSIQTYTFPSITRSGLLKIAISNITTNSAESADLSNIASSYVAIEVARDGSNYNDLILIVYDGIDDVTSNTVFSLSLSTQDIGTLKVKITAESQRIGSGLSLAIAPVTCNVADIVIV